MEINIRKMKKTDINNSVSLISNAMNSNEGEWARKTITFHFDCMEHGIDDGRDYYLWFQNNTVAGIVGLHHYEWGPPENVWLAWFAILPELQGKGYGQKLLDAVEGKAKKIGYKKFFVETYNHPDFNKAIRFYKKYGFVEAGRIDNYLPDDSSMIVLFKLF
jgi:GNAT superfamily N-acetyltransferase